MTAREWLRTGIDLEVADLNSARGGGYWTPEENKVYLYTAQYEAAVHELAHAWWHERRIGQEEATTRATIALSEETDPRHRRMRDLAYGYIHGIPAQGWAGIIVDQPSRFSSVISQLIRRPLRLIRCTLSPRWLPTRGAASRRGGHPRHQ